MESTVAYKLYVGDSDTYVGTAEVQYPDVENNTVTVEGTGIAGSFEQVIPGSIKPMSVTVKFKETTGAVIEMMKPEYQKVTLRRYLQQDDPINHSTKNAVERNVMYLANKKYSGGTVAQATATAASGEYACRSWQRYVDEKKVVDIDQSAMVCMIGDTDYLSAVRDAI